MEKDCIPVEFLTPSCIGKQAVLISVCEVLAQTAFTVFMQKAVFKLSALKFLSHFSVFKLWACAPCHGGTLLPHRALETELGGQAWWWPLRAVMFSLRVKHFYSVLLLFH